MTMTTLPTPPSRGDSPADFSAKADALLGALPTFVTEANALETNVVAKESSATAAASSAATSAGTATSAASTATTQAGIATTKASEAAASAASAALYAPFKTSATGSNITATGTTAQRDGTPQFGYQRANSTTGQMEWWNGTSWSAMGGGATGGGSDQIFWKNGQTITSNYTILGTENAGTFGPVTIADGVTVTINDGGSWTQV